MSDTINQPIGWRVAAIKIEPGKLNGGKAWTEDTVYADKEVAERYKDHLKASGWVASVTPQYAAPKARGKARKALQLRTAPPGFNQDWRLHQDKDAAHEALIGAVAEDMIEEAGKEIPCSRN